MGPLTSSAMQQITVTSEGRLATNRLMALFDSKEKYHTKKAVPGGFIHYDILPRGAPSSAHYQ